MSLLLVGVGLAVALTFFAGSPARDADAASKTESLDRTSSRPDTAVVSPEVEKSVEKSPDRATEDRRAGLRQKRRAAASRGPEDRTLKVSVPKMSRISDTTVPYEDGGNEAAFKKYAGVHLRGTGSPWDREANVYIAGHRLGYPGTDSFLAFWDLNKLGEGDRIFVTDAAGKRYVYKVFREFVVEPTQVSVTRPLEGRNILTLQTCTLPDYSRRLIVQAEKVA
jgi:sortase A